MNALPLLLLPALLCDADLYRAQIEAVADLADPEVITVAEPSLETSAALVLRRAPARFALGGTSAGGSLALEILAAEPSRVLGLWLTGSNPGAHGDPAGARRLCELARAGDFEKVLDELSPRCIEPGGPRAEPALATLRAMARRAGPEVFLSQSEAVITRRDRWSVLDTLGVPTLLLWGRQDQFSPPERAAAIATRVPSADVVVLDDCGHLPTLERPAESTAAVRAWLERVRAHAH